MKAGCCIVLLLVAASVAEAQQTQAATLFGNVRAESSLEPVPFAVVEVVGTTRRATADARGYFAIAGLAQGNYTIRATALGYKTSQTSAQVTTSRTRLDLTLAPQPFAIERIEVVADEETTRPRDAGPPPVTMDATMLTLVPGLAETDVLRSLEALPSIQTASDYSSALYVRGGSPDQNLITIDGAPIFNPYHLGGIFAAIDPDAVATVQVYPGAMPARVGDRASSTINIFTREGGQDRTRAQGAIGVISTRAAVDGPIDDRTTYLASLRRTYLDLFTTVADKLGVISESLPYNFTDGHLKITRRLASGGRLSLSGYLDRERFLHSDPNFGQAPEDRFIWGSRALTLSYRQPIGGRLLLDARASYSAFSADIRLHSVSGVSFDNGPFELIDVDTSMLGNAFMRDVLGAVDVTWYRASHELRAGIQADRYLLRYDVRRAEDSFFSDLLPELDRAESLTALAGYVEDDWEISQTVRLRAGVRALSAGNAGSALMPRVGVRIQATPALAIDLGGGRYAQALHSFRNEESFLASFMAYDVLVPASRESGLTTSNDVVLGAEWRGINTSLRIDTYVKSMRDIPLAEIPSDPIDAPLLEVDNLHNSSASARGLELSARHERGAWGIWASYAFLDTRRKLEDMEFRPRFARRHTLDIMGATPLGARGRASVRLVAASGQAVTPTVSRFQPFHYKPGSGRIETRFNPEFILGDYNSASLPAYWRLDVSARKSYDKRWFGKSMIVTPYIQIINALNTKNVLISEPVLYGPGQSGALEHMPQLPVLPTFGLEWRF